MESKTDAGPASMTNEELAAIEDEEVLNKMVSQWYVTFNEFVSTIMYVYHANSVVREGVAFVQREKM